MSTIEFVTTWVIGPAIMCLVVILITRINERSMREESEHRAHMEQLRKRRSP